MDTALNLINIVKQIAEIGSAEDIETALATLKVIRPLKQYDFPAIELVETPEIVPQIVRIPWEDFQIDPLQMLSSVEVGKKVSLDGIYRALDALGWDVMANAKKTDAAEKEVSFAVRIPANLTVSGITILSEKEFMRYKNLIPDAGVLRWMLREWRPDANAIVISKNKLGRVSFRDLLRPVIHFSTDLSDHPLIGSTFMLGRESFTVIDKNTAIKTRPITERYWTGWALKQLSYKESGFQRYLEYWIRRTMLPHSAEEQGNPSFPEGTAYQVVLNREISVDTIRLFSWGDYVYYCGFIPMIDEKWCKCGGEGYILNNGDGSPSGIPGSWAIRIVIEYKAREGFSVRPGDTLEINGRSFTVFTEGKAISNQPLGVVKHNKSTDYKRILFVDAKEYPETILKNDPYARQFLWTWLKGEAYEAPEGALR